MTFDAEDALERAAIAEALTNIAYGLGRGGRDPDAASPADARGRCDCSGLTAWLHRLDRRQLLAAARGDRPNVWVDLDGDGDLDPAVVAWLGTGGIITDALGARRWYEPVDRPELGALLVYAADPNAGRGFGHVGMVTGGLPAEWDPRSLALWRRLQVVDCHGPNGRRPGVMQVDGGGWGRVWGARRGTMIVRRVG
jgi:hypothetical protein